MVPFNGYIRIIDYPYSLLYNNRLRASSIFSHRTSAVHISFAKVMTISGCGCQSSVSHIVHKKIKLLNVCQRNHPPFPQHNHAVHILVCLRSMPYNIIQYTHKNKNTIRPKRVQGIYRKLQHENMALSLRGICLSVYESWLKTNEGPHKANGNHILYFYGAIATQYVS